MTVLVATYSNPLGKGRQEPSAIHLREGAIEKLREHLFGAALGLRAGRSRCAC
jgi:hypothetical protein